jgi:hypothetical protein
MDARHRGIVRSLIRVGRRVDRIGPAQALSDIFLNRALAVEIALQSALSVHQLCAQEAILRVPRDRARLHVNACGGVHCRDLVTG